MLRASIQRLVLRANRLSFGRGDATRTRMPSERPHPQRPGAPGCKPSPEACAKCGAFPCASLQTQKFTATETSRRWPWFLAALGVVAAGNVEVVPETQRLRLRLVPQFLEDQAAQEIDDEMLASLTPLMLPETSKEFELVRETGERLVQANNLPPLTYHVVNDDEEVNAFVSAGGHVVVYTGMLRYLDTPDLLAVVLSHEIAHFLAHHINERNTANYVNTAVGKTLGTENSKSFNWITTFMLTLPLSRKLEIEADHIGLKLMARACFDLVAPRMVWQRMQDRQRRMVEDSRAAAEAAAAADRYDHHPTAAAADRYDHHPAAAAATAHAAPASSGGLRGIARIVTDTMLPESQIDRYWSTHPTYEQRIAYFTTGSNWMNEAEELRKAHCCSQPLGETERRRAMPVAQPVRWWVYLYNRFMS